MVHAVHHLLTGTPRRAIASRTRQSPSFSEAAGGSYIRRGQTGDSVCRLQMLLQARGFDVKADGVFDKDTKAAVRAFQRANGCKVDGIV